MDLKITENWIYEVYLSMTNFNKINEEKADWNGMATAIIP
jgi:hypothetical protein